MASKWKLNKKWDERSIPEKIWFVITIMILLYTAYNFIIGLQGMNRAMHNPDYATEVTREHRGDASGAAFYFLYDRLQSENNVTIKKINNSEEEILPIGEHVYQVKMRLDCTYRDDDYDLKRATEGRELTVEYIGEEDGDWDNQDNWKLKSIHYWNR